MAVVYGLTHIPSGRTYVGCTGGRSEVQRRQTIPQKLAKRFREHRCNLRAKTHSEPTLQRDWDTYGEGAYKMVVLEEVSDRVSDKREAEIRWMRKFDELGLLYNTRRESFMVSPEATRAGIEASRTAGRWHSGVPEDHGRKISEGKRKAKQLRQLNDIV